MSSDKSTDKYIELDWEEPWSPLYGSPILIPPNTMLWRGYDTRYEVIPDRYSYYSGLPQVMEYAKQNNRELGCFITTKQLRVMDIRFMINLLERIIQTNQKDKYINDFASTIISFGLCSLGHQIVLLKERYKEEISKPSNSIIKENIAKMIEIYRPRNLIEQKGIRVAETTNDGMTMGFLQELFKGLFDGFIAPRQYTVFHTEKSGQLNPELIIFSPKNSKLEMLQVYPSNIKTKKISELIEDKHQLVTMNMIKSGEKISMKLFLSGGDRNKKIVHNKSHYLDAFEDKLNVNDNTIKNKYEKAQIAGKRWNKTLKILEPIKSSGMIVSPFPRYMETGA